MEKEGSDDDIIEMIDSPPPAKRARTGPSPVLAPKPVVAPSGTSSSYFNNTKARPSGPSTSNIGSRSTSDSAPRKPHRRPAQLEAFRLSKHADTDVPPATQRERTAEQIKRAEAWDKRMNDGGVIRRRRSLALDEAAAAELRRIAGGGEGDIGTDEAPDVDTPLDEVDIPLLIEEGSERQKAAQGIGSKLAAKFTAKGGAAKGKKKKEPEPVGPSGQTYTPLEKQFMEIKAKNPDVLLMMEVGYKFKSVIGAGLLLPERELTIRFHGEDAKTASRELGIAAYVSCLQMLTIRFPSRNFYTASIPTHRLHIHVKKSAELLCTLPKHNQRADGQTYITRLQSRRHLADRNSRLEESW